MTHSNNGAIAPPSVEPPRLDAQTKDEVCSLMQLGFRRRIAAAYAGCSDSEVFQEIQRDAVFRRQLRHAARNSEARFLKFIMTAGEKHWQAAAWALERLHPERYLKQSVDTITNEQLQYAMKQLVDIVFEHVPEPDRRQAIEKRMTELLGDASKTPPPTDPHTTAATASPTNPTTRP